MAVDRQIALAGAAAGIGAVEHRIVLGLQVRRAFHRHGAADMDVGGVDFALGKAEGGEEVEARIVELSEIKPKLLDAELFAKRPLVEGELDVEGGGQRLF